jgi:hypothetical protein
MVKSCTGIFVGIQTSLNDIFHLEEIAPGKFRNLIMSESELVELESDLIHPLVKGPGAKRYCWESGNMRILVPYTTNGNRAVLIPEEELKSRYPKTWSYFSRYESKLREREKGKMDLPTGWWAYNYPKNIEKQLKPRLLVAGTAPELRVAADFNGSVVQDDRRVFAISVDDQSDLGFLLGLLNSPVCGYVFKRIARPKSGGFFDIEKQFIAPLPIPDASPEQRAEVAARARELQELHTHRRDTIAKLDQRLHSAQTAPVSPAPKEEWLWTAIGTPATWKQSPAAPAGLSARDLTAWAKQQHAAALQERLDTLDALLLPGAFLIVTNTDDELLLHIAGREALHLYDKPGTRFLAAQWRHALRNLNVTEAFNATRLLKLLLTLRTTTEEPLRQRILALDPEITTLDQTLATKKSALNALIYQLYHLTAEEIAMVEGG